MNYFPPVILSHLWGPASRQFGYLAKLKENVHSLRNEMIQLQFLRDDVKEMIDVAEQQLQKCTHQVDGWLRSVEAIEGEVNAIEEAFQQMTTCFGSCHPNCWSGYRLGKTVVKKLVEVVELKNKRAAFEVVAKKPLPDTVEEMPSRKTIGMDLMLETVRGILREDAVGVVGLCGMGGVGKTTLLKMINHEFVRRPHDFDVVIWVVVSKEANLAKIQNDIGDRLGLSWQENRSNDERRATDIHKVLSKKKFILLLDDVWQRLDLELVGIPHPNSLNKSKVIFTTRYEEVCGLMDADKKAKVDCLKWEESWELFQGKVGEEAMNSHPDIPTLAEIVAKECGGLPLALITIGRAMASKKTPKEWKHAITILSKSPSEISGMEDQVLFRLKFSYDNLGDETMKSCFLYCSLFPEDYSIDNKELIEYWIGEGFFDEFDDLDEARNKGYDLIGSLKVACLLESGFTQTQVKMHDVIRDLALWIAGECGAKKNKFLVRAGVRLTEAPQLQRWKEAERVSLMENKIRAQPEIPECPNLLTLMLQRNTSLVTIHNRFFQLMPRLRVLDLSCTNIEELPAGIGKLVDLRYLNLSCTQIATLPEEFGNMKNLKHLNLNSVSSLSKIPREVISRLYGLRVLKLYQSYVNWGVEGSGGYDLAELEGLKYLTHLEITIGTDLALEMFLGSHKLSKLTWSLEIKDCRCIKFAAMKSLGGLRMARCNELEELTLGADVKADNCLVSSLELLQLQQLLNLNVIQVGGSLQNLRYMYIGNCRKLRHVTWILLLQSLEEIYLRECEEIGELITTASGGSRGTNESEFRQLKCVHLKYLPNLTSICSSAFSFPSLEELVVIKCSKLKKLPLHLHNAKNCIRNICGEKEWWDNLEWEEDGTKSSFLPFFKEW